MLNKVENELIELGNNIGKYINNILWSKMYNN